jgi:hypothetical protein
MGRHLSLTARTHQFQPGRAHRLQPWRYLSVAPDRGVLGREMSLGRDAEQRRGLTDQRHGTETLELSLCLPQGRGCLVRPAKLH